MADSFESKIQRQIERLQTRSCRALERDTTERRIRWFQKRYRDADRPILPSPSTAYELLFFEYMGLSREDLPVIAESEDKIVWLSHNRCQTLEACTALGLDTRTVCRDIYEKSTQALVSQIDPQLRFGRSYDEIRPYAGHCKEWIVRIRFESLMALALEEAMASKREGNKGYGAVVVMGNKIVARAHDTAATEQDPSLHAEVDAIRQAVRAQSDTNLCGAVLLSTCEPCPMCASLAVWANVTTIVYGASIEETARLGRSRIRIGAQEIVDRSPATIEVIGGVLADDCLSLYRPGEN